MAFWLVGNLVVYLGNMKVASKVLKQAEAKVAVLVEKLVALLEMSRAVM